MIRIIHISDTHGTLPTLYGDGPVIHTGDMLPNVGEKIYEESFQESWLYSNKDRLINWVNGRQFIFCAGNHDFIDPVPIMQSMGIEAYNCTNALVEVGKVSVYGFPYVNYYRGRWNYELIPSGMSHMVEYLQDALEQHKPALLACHSPPYGVLDINSGYEHIGVPQITNMIWYGKQYVPDTILCGHVHENNGISFRNKKLFSNAATKVHYLELDI